jgi:hypothetical protein
VIAVWVTVGLFVMPTFVLGALWVVWYQLSDRW